MCLVSFYDSSWFRIHCANVFSFNVIDSPSRIELGKSALVYYHFKG